MLWRTDFHTHTIYSPDSLTRPEKLVAAARRRGIARLIVTDHNCIAGALRCKELDPEGVIVGEEIMTTQGELLAAFVHEEVPAGLPPLEAIARLRAQNAFISVSHPFDQHRKGHWKEADLQAILPHIDAIETFNARCMFPWYNWRAADYAQAHNILGTCGSDAHAAFEVGRGALLLPPFEDAASLKEALKGAVAPPLILSTPLVHLTSRWAAWRKRLAQRG